MGEGREGGKGRDGLVSVGIPFVCVVVVVAVVVVVVVVVVIVF